MNQSDPYADVKNVVKLDSNLSQACQASGCEGDWFEGAEIDAAINHYIQQHGYRLLHVGTESRPRSKDDTICHHTVAILGSARAS